jgi:hypothetical protein
VEPVTHLSFDKNFGKLTDDTDKSLCNRPIPFPLYNRSRTMFTRTLGIATLGLVVCIFGANAAQDKDSPKKTYEVPKNAIAGKIKAVDVKTATFTITLKDGKDRKFTVDDKTEFWGPKGGDRGTGAKGLEDDCMEKGYEIKVVPAKDTKIAKDVHLPNRKTAQEKGKS